MKKLVRREFALSIPFSLVLALVGCGDPGKQAQKAVESKGYEWKVEDFLEAAAKGDLEGMEAFASAGMEVDSVDPAGNTALIKAAGVGQIAAVERLLGLGADPRKANLAGRDALIATSAKGFEEVARMLMGRGANISHRDSEGWSALSLAAYNGHEKVVSLLAAGATSSELDDALLVASFSGDPAVIDSLLGQGANINVRSPEGKTPLMIASASGKVETVRVLLQNHANPYAVDPENRTATNLAEAAGHVEIAKLITDPSSWGSSESGQVVAGEMAEARNALAGRGVEENLLEGMNLSGEPTRPALASPAGGGKGSGKKESAPASAGSVPGKPREAASSAMAANSATPSAAGAEGAPAPRIEKSRRVREAARDKPIVALNGSILHSRRPEEAPVKEMVLAAFHEESLPLLVDGVNGNTASVRRLDRSGESVAVEEGGMVPGTPFRIREVTPRFVSSKEGKGRMVDVSRVEVEDTRRGSTHFLVKDASGQTADTYAILTSANSRYRYVVKAGDVFRTTQPGVGAKEYQVLDIRANAVVIKDLAGGEVTTVARDGVIQP